MSSVQFQLQSVQFGLVRLNDKNLTTSYMVLDDFFFNKTITQNFELDVHFPVGRLLNISFKQKNKKLT